jgi:hypothetical protein
MASSKSDAQTSSLPPDLEALFDSELERGNRLVAVEFERKEWKGQFAFVLEKPLRPRRKPLPDSIQYIETEAKDRWLFEFVDRDGGFSLAYVQRKAAAVSPLPEGPSVPPLPPIPEIPRRETAPEAVAPPTVELAPDSAPHQEPGPGSAAERFLQSMTMTFDMWHDGTGYDLEALRAVPPGELPAIEAHLIDHRPRDWRDIEALAQIDSPTARAAVADALNDRDPQVRREAARYSEQTLDPAEREALLLQSLKNDVFFGGLSQALDEVEEFHPPAVIDALLRGALHREGDVAVHFAAMLYFLHGKSREAFDWDHRPFFLRFNTPDTDERQAAFRELCETIGVDSRKYLKPV